MALIDSEVVLPGPTADPHAYLRSHLAWLPGQPCERHTVKLAPSVKREKIALSNCPGASAIGKTELIRLTRPFPAAT